MYPPPEASQQQLQLLDLLSQTKTGLVVHLPNHQQLVLCPEGSTADGDLSVAAVLMKHHEQQQQVKHEK